MLNYNRIKLNGKDNPNRSKNYGKTTFTPEEINQFTKAIVITPRDIKSAAIVLEVEEELVETFLDKFKARDPIWMNRARRLKLHNYEARTVLPPINMPPVIPKIGSMQK